MELLSYQPHGPRGSHAADRRIGGRCAHHGTPLDGRWIIRRRDRRHTPASVDPTLDQKQALAGVEADAHKTALRFRMVGFNRRYSPADPPTEHPARMPGDAIDTDFTGCVGRHTWTAREKNSVAPASAPTNAGTTETGGPVGPSLPFIRYNAAPRAKVNRARRDTSNSPHFRLSPVTDRSQSVHRGREHRVTARHPVPRTSSRSRHSPIQRRR